MTAAPPSIACTSPREAGFTLVMFVMVVAVMSIMMGVAVQSVSFQMQREREAELIFRGEQYVEAIRLYRARYGRYPMRLKEIWEADPKVIRKPWKDPITNSESWGIIFLGQENQPGGRLDSQRDIGLGDPRPTGTPEAGGPQELGRFGTGEDDALPPGTERNPEGEIIGPIVGVHSTSCDDSIKVYEGRTTYCEWRFIFREDRQPGAGGRGRLGGRGRGRGGPPGEGGRPAYTPMPRSTGTPNPRF
jgi:type II secretory pathway pseudopilin PulG